MAESILEISNFFVKISTLAVESLVLALAVIPYLSAWLVLVLVIVTLFRNWSSDPKLIWENSLAALVIAETA